LAATAATPPVKARAPAVIPIIAPVDKPAPAVDKPAAAVAAVPAVVAVTVMMPPLMTAVWPATMMDVEIITPVGDSADIVNEPSVQVTVAVVASPTLY